MHNGLTSACLSLLLPGLGQWKNKDTAKGTALVCMSIGVWTGVLLAAVGPQVCRSHFTVLLLSIVYLLIWIPAISDAYQFANGNSSSLLSGEKKWYVIVMLLSIGPMALPMLWQSPKFSRASKQAWSAFVLILFFLSVLFMVIFVPALERTLQNFGISLNSITL